MSNRFIEQHQEEFNKAVEHFEKELSAVRAGRANPSMLDSVAVDAYGVKTPLKQVASISVPEARSMEVEPWDKNLIKEVEKAISAADLGLSVSAESTLVRVTVPQMTEEKRKEMVKQIKEKLEEARVAVRSIREKVKEDITEAEKSKDITEDDKYDFVEDLDKKVSELNKKLENMAEEKEKQVMS